LRSDLEKAVREEAYERAAKIRDRIYELEGREPQA
jgi:protein-arginine kinase activator protein McsA